MARGVVSGSHLLRIRGGFGCCRGGPHRGVAEHAVRGGDDGSTRAGEARDRMDEVHRAGGCAE